MDLSAKLAHAAIVITKYVKEGGYSVFDGVMYERILNAEGIKTCAWRRVCTLRDVVSSTVGGVKALGGRNLNINIKAVLRVINETDPAEGIPRIQPKDHIAAFKDYSVDIITQAIYRHGNPNMPKDWCTLNYLDVNLNTHIDSYDLRVTLRGVDAPQPDALTRGVDSGSRPLEMTDVDLDEAVYQKDEKNV